MVLSIYSLTSCSGEYNATAWRASGVDFRNYRTFSWAAPGDTALTMRRDDKLFAGTIYLYANGELKKKGMTFVKAKPDAVFMFDTQVQDHTRYEQSAQLSVGIAYGGPGYYVGGSAPVAGGKITAVPYQDGRLIIEMFDTRTRQLVWRGWAQKSLDGTTDVGQTIKRAIEDIMFKLPIRHKT